MTHVCSEDFNCIGVSRTSCVKTLVTFLQMPGSFINWPAAEPGLRPRFPGGRQHINWPKFVENCMEMKKIGPRREVRFQNFTV